MEAAGSKLESTFPAGSPAGKLAQVRAYDSVHQTPPRSDPAVEDQLQLLTGAFSAALEEALQIEDAKVGVRDAMSSSSQAAESWISAFCSLVGHEYFAEVSEDFIEDDFNLTGLQSQVPMYKEALEMILDVEPEDVSDEDDEEEEDDDEDEDDMQDGNGVRGAYRRAADAGAAAVAAAERRHSRMASDLSVIESSAETLYGLIHQRFITSRAGIQQMAEKYELGHFGFCPRVHCHAAKVLPVGCSDIPGQETVKLFCPSCLDVYTPPNSRFQTVDGAFFGTTFGCLFFMTFPELEVGGFRPPTTHDPLAASSHKQMTASSSLNPSSHPGASSNLQGNAPPDIINGIAVKNLAPGLGTGNIYEPRIYGFRVAEVAKNGPRMKWLRSRPDNINDLDECRQWAEMQQAESHTLNNRRGVSGVPADLADSEMADENTVIDEGEIEDDEMESTSRLVRDEGNDARPHDSAQAEKVVRRRQNGEGLLKGEGIGNAAVRVGDGG